MTQEPTDRCLDCGTVEYRYIDRDNDLARLDCSVDHPFPTAEPVTDAGRQADAELRERAARRATWPHGEPDLVREAEEFDRKLDRLVQRIEREYGPMASNTMLRVLTAVTDDPPKLTEDEGADLLRLVGAGEWEAAAARLDEVAES